MVSILGVLMINVVAVYAVFTDQPFFYLVLQLVYVFSLVLHSIWFLSRLGALEKERPEPDDEMKLAFRAALGFPIIAYRCGGARPDGYRGFRGLETRQNSRDDIVARRQPGGRIGAVHTGHVLLPHAGAGHRHHHTGPRVAVCVDDGTVDRASCLGCRRYCDRQRQQHDSDGAPANSYRRPMLWLSCERSPLRAFYEPDDRRRQAVFESSQRHAGLPARPQTPRRPPRAVETGSFRGGATAVLIVPDTPVRPSRGRVRMERCMSLLIYRHTPSMTRCSRRWADVSRRSRI